jgi:hypothetical protein
LPFQEKERRSETNAMTNTIDDLINDDIQFYGSTGPRTPEGKFESSKNAISHGLTASTIDRFPEHIREDYASFLAEQYEEYNPVTTNERDFLEQFAFNRFQISRASSMISDAWEKLAANPGDEILEKKYQKLNRHVRALERTAKYALAELRTFIADRIRNNELRLNLPSFVRDEIAFPVAYPSHKMLSAKPKKDEIKSVVRLYLEELLTRYPTHEICKQEVLDAFNREMEKATKAEDAAKQGNSQESEKKSN